MVLQNNLSADVAYIISYHDAIGLDDHHVLEKPYGNHFAIPLIHSH